MRWECSSGVSKDMRKRAWAQRDYEEVGREYGEIIGETEVGLRKLRLPGRIYKVGDAMWRQERDYGSYEEAWEYKWGPGSYE
ncbi:hypothetical protein Pmani_014929, partial [Petrolisthes manimaculis]